MKTLVWFRNDLRLSDNPALSRAAIDSDAIEAVYIHCHEYVKSHPVAPVRLHFIFEHLQLLGDKLAAQGISLTLLEVKTAKEIPAAILKLAQQKSCDQLHINAEYPLDEFVRDKNVAATCKAAGIIVRRFHDRVIVPPGMIRNGQGLPYKVFTAFKRTWLQQATAVSWASPSSAPAFPKAAACKFDNAVLKKWFAEADDRVAAHWPAGEAEAHERLKDFMDTAIRHYHETRDFPATEGTSTLSPYLAVGSISPRQCLGAALHVNGGEWDTGSEGVTTWINELIWRDFYQHVVTDFPQVCKHNPMQTYTDQFPWRKDEKVFDRWCQGQTGIPIVDAAMRQLLQTGWMHNRLRMVVAMFLTKNLQIDWRWGERWFMSRLIDGDFAANNGGWQWSASTGTDAAPYFRVFNPVSQSRKFDPEGHFIRQYVPELAHLDKKNIHQPPPVNGYPLPIVDLVVSRKQTIELFGKLDRKPGETGN